MKFFLALCLVASLSVAAKARPIEYTWQAVGAGTFGTTAFSDSPFTVTLLGDTNDVQTPIPGDLSIVGSDLSVSVPGIGTGSILLSRFTRLYSTGNLTLGTGGGRALSLSILLSNASLQNWNMASSIVVTGTATVGSILGGVQTSIGNFYVVPGDRSLTFTARFIPEPCSILLAVGLALIGACRRHPGR